MRPFATANDLEARWRVLSASEKGQAETMLGDASAVIASELARSGIALDESDEIQAANLKATCCAMVKRAMNAGDELSGVSQYSQTAGSYSFSATAANLNGDLYMTSNERKRLGIGKGMMGSIRPKIGAADDTW